MFVVPIFVPERIVLPSFQYTVQLSYEPHINNRRVRRVTGWEINSTRRGINMVKGKRTRKEIAGKTKPAWAARMTYMDQMQPKMEIVSNQPKAGVYSSWLISLKKSLRE